MQALAIAPADMPPAGPPPAAASAKTGSEGLFASRLKTATEQQTPTAAPTDSGKKPSSSHGDDLKPKPEHADDASEQQDPAASATSLNGLAGAASQQPAGPPPAVATEAGANSVAAPVPGGESAMARMLTALTAGEPAALSRTGSPPLSAPQDKAGQPVFSPESLPEAGRQAPATAASVPPALAPVSAQSIDTGGETGAALFSDRLPQPGDNPLSPPITVSFTAAPASAPGQAGTGNQQVDQAAGQTPVAVAMAPSSAETGAVGQQPPALPNDPLIVQNGYGQIITIYQGNGVDTETAMADGGGKTAPTTTDGLRLDIDSNYIHAHLPKDTPDNAPDGGDSPPQNSTTSAQAQETTASADPVKNAPVAGEQTVLQKTAPAVGQETPPLTFTHQPITGPQTSNSATPASSFQLPSGLIVPEGTVVDQMIAHFSVNRQIESGTVNLRLSPQELGELRLEIKVEQDNIKAHFIAQSPQAQEMLDRHLPRLREALQQQGLHLQQVEVTIAAHDHTGNERFRENGAWQQPNPSAHRTASDQPAFALETDDIAGEDYSGVNTLSVLA